MSDSSDWKKVGKVKDAHGIRGELYLLVFSGDVSWLEELKSLRLENPSATQIREFKVSRSREHKGGLIVSSPEIQNRNQAEELKGWSFYVPASFFVSEPGEDIYLSEIEGFEVADIKQGNLGRIVGFSFNGAQDLLQVKRADGKQFDIPFVDEFVVEILWEAKAISVELPEGLVEIQLGEDKDDFGGRG